MTITKMNLRQWKFCKVNGIEERFIFSVKLFSVMLMCVYFKIIFTLLLSYHSFYFQLEKNSNIS